jgi:hypothetical protein
MSGLFHSDRGRRIRASTDIGSVLAPTTMRSLPETMTRSPGSSSEAPRHRPRRWLDAIVTGLTEGRRCDMDIAVWVSGLTALLGVGLGGLLSSRAQDRAWRREEQRRWQEARRTAYGNLVAAVRQYRSYVSQPDTQIDVWTHPSGERLVPGIGGEGTTVQAAMEAAFTTVQMMARDQETVNQAHLLTSVARRVAVGRAIHGPGRLHVDLDETQFRAEHDFLKSARRDLGLHDMTTVPFPRTLTEIDARLLADYQNAAS